MVAKSTAISVFFFSFVLMNVVSAFKLRNEATNRYLEERNGKVISRFLNFHDNQKWNMVQTLDANFFRIVNVLTNKHLESDFSGKVFTADPKGISSQEWRYLDNKLVNRGTLLSLDARTSEYDLDANFPNQGKYQNWIRED